jgi:hypothetical protein
VSEATAPSRSGGGGWSEHEDEQRELVCEVDGAVEGGDGAAGGSLDDGGHRGGKGPLKSLALLEDGVRVLGGDEQLLGGRERDPEYAEREVLFEEGADMLAWAFIGGCLMRLSSSFGRSRFVGLAGAQDGVQDVDAASCERDDGLVVGFSFGALAGVEGLAGGVAERAEGRLEEDAFERLVAARRRCGPAGPRADARCRSTLMPPSSAACGPTPTTALATRREVVMAVLAAGPKRPGASRTSGGWRPGRVHNGNGPPWSDGPLPREAGGSRWRASTP